MGDMNQVTVTGTRFVSVEAAAPEARDDGTYRIVGSTSAPVMVDVMRNGKKVRMREILSHEPGAADVSAMKSLLLNHKRGAIIGAIRGYDLDGEIGFADAAIHDNARLETGVSVREAVDAGSLRGASLGFRYNMEDADVDFEAGEIRVNKWRALELSLTSVPEDPGASVRSVDLGEVAEDESPQEIVTHTRSAEMADENQTQEGEQVETVAHSRTSEQPIPAGISVEEAREVCRMAEDHGLRSVDYIGMSKADAAVKILGAVKQRAAQEHPATSEAVGPSIRVMQDEVQKAERAAGEFLMERSFGERAADNPLVGRRITDAAKRYAAMCGVRGAMDWDDKDAASFALGDYRNMSSGARSAANISTASFPDFINLNAVTKVVARGFEQGTGAANYGLWTERQVVPDFKQFSIGGLGTANLEETAENVALPELSKSEGVYQSNAKLWGGTLSLSIQALINDDTREFDRSLRQAGAIAQKTINKRAYEKLLGKTWTNNTTQGTIVSTTADTLVAARANLDTVISAMLSKTGKDGNPLGNMPQFLIVPPALGTAARSIVGAVQPGQVNGDNRSLQVIESPWLSAGILSGNSATTYYLVCSPNEATAGVVSFIRGYEQVQVNEYDSGAVAARKWKIWLPFEADVVDFGGLIFGAHRGTA